jgi:hypothetical protein
MLPNAEIDSIPLLYLGQWKVKMFIAIRKYEGTINIAEINRLAETDLIPALKAQPGFVSYHLASVAADAIVSVSIFATRQQAEPANQIAQGVVRKVSAGLMPNPPTVIMGEVLSHVTA